MTISLRTTSYAAALTVAVLLSVLLLLGSRQHRADKQLETIIQKNEKLLFRYATIREQITETLLEGEYQKLSAISREIEELNSQLTQTLQDPLIPDEYRLSFAGQVDLAGIVLLLRNIGAGETSQVKVRQLNQELRVLGDRLILFDRLVADHGKRKIVGFQNIVIGLLAIMVFVVIYILVFWHRRVAHPLLRLISQLRDVARGRRSEIILPGRTGEITELTDQYRNLLTGLQNSHEKLRRQHLLLTAIKRIQKAADRPPAEEKLLGETCRALLANQDYSLVWIGRPTADGGLTPVAVDGSTSMSRRETDECLAALLNLAGEGEPSEDAGRQALEMQRPVVRNDFLSGKPRGPFKETPLASGRTAWAAIPLLQAGDTLGVMNIYSTADDGFVEEETELLATLADEVVGIITCGRNRLSARREAHIRREVFSFFRILSVGISEEGIIQTTNEAAARELGYDPGQLEGRDWFSLLTSEDQKSHRQGLGAMVKGHAPELPKSEVHLLAADGASRAYRFRYFRPLPLEAGTNEVMWIGTDISSPRWLSENIARLQTAQHRLFAICKDPVLVCTGDGTILEANPAFLSLAGCDHEACISRNLFDLLTFRNQSHQELKDALRSGISELELALTKPDGKYRLSLTPLPGRPGEPETLLLIARDITAETTHRNNLIKASGLAAMGELAAGVAHEINNLTNSLINQAEILADELAVLDTASGDEGVRQLLDSIMQEGDRIAVIAQQLLSFNTGRGQLIDTVQIEKVVADSLALVRQQYEQDCIHAAAEFPPICPPVRVNAQKMQHVFLNILNNARYALNKRYNGKHANKRLLIKGEVVQDKDNPLLRVSFTDWGQGVPPDIQDKIFEPFFSTKPPGEGTGLGLSICRNLLEECRGNICLESLPEDHTTIIIDLPYVTSP